MMDNRCCICHGEKPEALKILSANGLQTMVNAAVEGSNTLPPEIHAGVGYHNSCRSKKIRELKKKSEEVKPRTSHRHEFHIRLDCLYCERTLKMFNEADQGLSDREKRVDWVHPRYKDLASKVETDGPNSFEETLHWKITERLEKNPDDTWALEVLGRISSVSLRAADAIYDKGCAARFSTGRKKPGESTHNVGAPKDIVRRLIFDETFADMQEENKDDGGMRISEIYERMEQRVRGTEHDPFSIRSICRILEEDDYKEIVTVVRRFALFQESTQEILRKHVEELKGANVENQAAATIVKAATLIRGQIAEHRLNLPSDSYFALEDLTVEQMVKFLPSLLKLFLDNLYPRRVIRNDTKIAAVGQLLMNLVPRKTKVPMPMLMGLSALIHKRTGNRMLVDLLSRFSLCETYTEVLRFNRNVAVMKPSSTGCTSSEWSDIHATDNADAIQDAIPPTADAVGLHAQRSYLQIQEWSGNSLRPESYGWKKVDGILEPIPMGQEPAPPFLMEVKKCGCTSGCRNRICRCVADGLACTDKCSCGETCENPKNSENNDDADDEVFDDAHSESSDEERD